MTTTANQKVLASPWGEARPCDHHAITSCGAPAVAEVDGGYGLTWRACEFHVNYFAGWVFDNHPGRGVCVRYADGAITRLTSL